jgi:hypothetical protein
MLFWFSASQTNSPESYAMLIPRPYRYWEATQADSATASKTTKSGMPIDPNDPLALANLLKQPSENLNQLQNMGMADLKKVRTLTHQEMHRQRWQLLLKMLDRSKN